MCDIASSPFVSAIRSFSPLVRQRAVQPGPMPTAGCSDWSVGLYTSSGVIEEQDVRVGEETTRCRVACQPNSAFYIHIEADSNPEGVYVIFELDGIQFDHFWIRSYGWQKVVDGDIIQYAWVSPEPNHGVRIKHTLPDSINVGLHGTIVVTLYSLAGHKEIPEAYHLQEPIKNRSSKQPRQLYYAHINGVVQPNVPQRLERLPTTNTLTQIIGRVVFSYAESALDKRSHNSQMWSSWKRSSDSTLHSLKRNPEPVASNQAVVQMPRASAGRFVKRPHSALTHTADTMTPSSSKRLRARPEDWRPGVSSVFSESTKTLGSDPVDGHEESRQSETFKAKLAGTTRLPSPINRRYPGNASGTGSPAKRGQNATSTQRHLETKTISKKQPVAEHNRPGHSPKLSDANGGASSSYIGHSQGEDGHSGPSAVGTSRSAPLPLPRSRGITDYEHLPGPRPMPEADLEILLPSISNGIQRARVPPGPPKQPFAAVNELERSMAKAVKVSELSLGDRILQEVTMGRPGSYSQNIEDKIKEIESDNDKLSAKITRLEAAKQDNDKALCILRGLQHALRPQ
ncbi:hypothetical protein CERSUDRAFT_125153 [Gelatoporia subvermispora B]|uniref:Uncharacterized protein n=1 Tax=Ceriporiopsis subvermispora (strain B) TaxID=914234 RepID=M2R9T7_CERS8|nr:hypothetical protein CERSUDRAFT_125153 [Gelatoporia subvermispora B]